MAGRRNPVGMALTAFAALGLAALSAWIVLGSPPSPPGAPVRPDGAGGAPDTRAAIAESGAAQDPEPTRGVPGGGLAGATGSRHDGAGVEAADARSGLARATEAGSSGTEQATDEEHQERERLATGMAKLMSDLEFSPGLKEPPQQLVQPQPDPWRRDPSREGPPPAIEAIVPRRARAGGGDRISIRGRNLRVVQVMFGATPARLVAARGNEVIVETPPGTVGPVTVAVTNDDGTWAIAAEPFVYGD